MIKRELKVNFKSFILWTTILIAMFLVVFLVYPFIVTDDSMKNLDEMMKVFPQELLKSFNMDITSINTAYGWLKSEGFMFLMIIVGIYSSSLGFNILLKEEYDKTIEYLGCVPITRNRLITNKIIVSIIYIISMICLIGIFNYIALEMSGEFNHKQYLLLSITPIFIAIPLFALNLFISTLIKRPKKNISISLGLVVFFYAINVLSELSDKISFLKFFSIYTLADIRHVIEKVNINPINVVISIIISLIFLLGTYVIYDKKEFF